MRLTRLLALRGVASRREAERFVADGRVTVNGEVASGVVLVNPETDNVRVDGRPLPAEPEPLYFLLYKPKGVLVTREDPEGRPSVYALLGDLGDKVEAVGRL